MWIWLGFGVDPAFFTSELHTYVKVYATSPHASIFLAGIWFLWCSRNQWVFKSSHSPRDVLLERSLILLSCALPCGLVLISAVTLYGLVGRLLPFFFLEV